MTQPTGLLQPNPDAKLAHSVRSEVELAIGEYSRAVADAEWVVDAESGQPDALIRRAAAYLFRRHAADAIADFTQALDSKIPLDAMNIGNAYALRSLALDMLGRSAESIADFASATKALEPLGHELRSPVFNQRCYFASAESLFLVGWTSG